MGTEISTETADTDEIDDPTFEPSSANQKDEPAPDQLPDDETPPRSKEDETDPPDATGPPSAFRAAIQSEPLKNILRALRATVDEARLKIDFGTEFPAMLSYNLGDGDGSMTRMLAPRIET